MGKRGPKPIPRELLALRGSRRAAGRGDQPSVDYSAPEAPSWLAGASLDVWRQVVPLLSATGVLATIDAQVLGRYCVLFARWRAAEDFLAQHGEAHPVKDSLGRMKGVRQWPQVRIARDLSAALGRIEAEFGMTPSSRSRIVVAPNAAPRPAILDFINS